jgi:hypothetical protein
MRVGKQRTWRYVMQETYESPGYVEAHVHCGFIWTSRC